MFFRLKDSPQGFYVGKNSKSHFDFATGEDPFEISGDL